MPSPNEPRLSDDARRRRKSAKEGSARRRFHDTIALVTGDRSPETRRTVVAEQEQIPTSNEPAAPSAIEKKSTKKSKPAGRKTGAPAKRSTQTTAALTDDEKRLARNAALREWRKKNADRVKAYMTEWREKRKGKQPALAATPDANVPARAAKKKSTTEPKKGGKA
jgi:hypothetical protein